ncbi:hypothetical protein FIV42_28530 [Persicimonas caeni]|uniref:Tetratricopeptide repeat protein n=1 Tax=Persicimonas caeni TaxID=2292766 RepID=A0A4Y6Q247_PERCE|nr:hypothetical protein [Persicimonas caeni]QDG54549.1 hypothetical protein FIV42_28530 [Persicimonas caeni]QED35770.1 hypothetical protein FRD00_28525 [Persicimonas caeni]
MNVNGRLCLILILASLLAAAPACRTGTTPEAGVDARLFETPDAALGYSPRGYWFALTEQNQPITNFVTITHDGQTELFYAVARGERAAQLLPLTPVESSWFAEAVEAGAKPDFTDTLEGVQSSDAIGIWEGGDAPVEWIGPKPEGPITAVAMPVEAPEKAAPFYRWAKGVVDIDAGTASASDGKLDKGPYLLIPDGVDKPEKVRVVSLAPTARELPEGEDGLTLSNQKPVEFSNKTISEYITLPVGRQVGADVLFFDVGSETFVSNVGPDAARLGDEARLVAAAAEIPFHVRDETKFVDIARGFEALREGRALAAAYWLQPDVLSAAKNADATPLRLAELPAAAGLAQWSRLALLETADGMGADRVLYLARAHALEGDLGQAGTYAMRSSSSFRDWPPPAKRTGMARAKLLMARLAALDGEVTDSIDFARSAIEDYALVEDALRRADAEMQLAGYLFEAGSPDGAVKNVKLARSRYYHGGAPYFSALAEIKLAQFLLEANRPKEAIEMAGYAVARMKKFDEPVGLNRASIVQAIARHHVGEKHDISGELKNGLAQARELGDLEAQALAASALVTLTGVDGQEEMLEVAKTLMQTRDDVVDAVAERRTQRAMAALCGQGLAKVAASEDVAGACEQAVANVAGDPETLQAWLEQGYKALQSGNLTLAQSTAAQLADSLDEQLEQTSAVLAAKIHMFQYALATRPAPGAGDRPDDASLAKAMALLDKGLDPATAAARLHELALEQRTRGMTQIAGRLGEKAMASARAEKQYDRERELLFFLLETYRVADQPNEVLQLARDGRKVVSRAGPGSDALEARVLIYQSDAEYRLGRTSDAGLHRSNALATANKAETPERLELLLLAAELDMDRQATEAAEPAIVTGLNIYTSLSPEKRTSSELMPSLTRLHTLHGELGVRLGKLDAARKAFDIALALSSESKTPEVLATRAQTLAYRAGLTRDAQNRSTYETDLAAALEELGGFTAPQAATRAHRAAVEYFVDAGDASRALDIADRVHDAGLSLAPREQAPCITGRARLFAGKTEQATKDLETCQAANPADVSGAFASLLVTLTDESLGAAERAQKAASLQAKFDDKLTEAEADRLEFIVSLAKPDKTYEDRRAERLKASADKSQKPAEVAAYADYLLSVGRIAEANAYVDDHSTVFFEQGQESPGTLIRLRLEAMVRQLQPVEASLFARRALSETRDLSDDERARIDFLRAQNEVVAGRWWQAANLLTQARDAASDRELKSEIAAFTKKFPPLAD